MKLYDDDDDGANDHHHDNGGIAEEEEKDQQQQQQQMQPIITCTYAVTGTQALFQSIFVCKTCHINNHNNNNNNDTTTTAPNISTSCICAGCADVCHMDHQVIYMGMGPAYCDCINLRPPPPHQRFGNASSSSCGGCQLQQVSQQQAVQLGIHASSSKNRAWQRGQELFAKMMMLPSRNRTNDNNNNEKDNDDENLQIDHVMNVYRIPALQEQPFYRQRLVQQALALVQHSRETFWIDASCCSTDSVAEEESQQQGWCDLERLAHQIYRRHVKYYQLLEGDDHNDVSIISGAEWWVQVKPNKTFSRIAKVIPAAGIVEEVNDDDDHHHHQQQQQTKQPQQQHFVSSSSNNQAIDLHYDKDEALAEAFGLGWFPTLSTVTYLTSGNHNNHNNTSTTTSMMAPTLILPHTYDQPETKVMDYMMVCHPRVGKHVVFDGRLLHGAPAHDALREKPRPYDIVDNNNNNDNNDDDEDNHDEHDMRITFLVNLWFTGRPAGVKPLPEEIRNVLRRLGGGNEEEHHHHHRSDHHHHMIDLEFIDEHVEIIHLDRNKNMAEDLHRIELPFVSKGATWIGGGGEDVDDDDDDDDDEGIRLITYPPPSSSSSDSMLVHFGPGLQAYLERKDDDELDNDDDDQDGGNVKPAVAYQEFYV